VSLATVQILIQESEVASAIMMAVRRWQFVNYALGNPLNQEHAEGNQLHPFLDKWKERIQEFDTRT
jgi:hypothetical protein